MREVKANLRPSAGSGPPAEGEVGESGGLADARSILVELRTRRPTWPRRRICIGNRERRAKSADRTRRADGNTRDSRHDRNHDRRVRRRSETAGARANPTSSTLSSLCLYTNKILSYKNTLHFTIPEVMLYL